MSFGDKKLSEIAVSVPGSTSLLREYDLNFRMVKLSFTNNQKQPVITVQNMRIMRLVISST